MGGACVLGGVVVNVANVGVVNVGVVNVGVVVLGRIVVGRSTTCRFPTGLMLLQRSLSQHSPLRFDALRPISVGAPEPNNRVQT